MKKLIVLIAVVIAFSGCQTLFDNTTPEERIAYVQTALEAAQQGYQMWLEYRDYQDAMDEREYQRELTERRERMERLQGVLDSLIEAAGKTKEESQET